MDKRTEIAKIVVSRNNLPFLFRIIDKIKRLGIRKVKFVLPFQTSSSDNDMLLSLVDAVYDIDRAKNYAEKKRVSVVQDKDLEYNPYLPPDLDFFDTQKAKLEINSKKYEEKPKFSVIIPTFNRKKTLPFVLNNFLKQDYPKSKYELIVVDDGSNDGTLGLIKKMKLTCNFKYFYWPRKKIKLGDNLKKFAKFYNRAGLARNIGIDNADGEIILFNDADILVTRDCLKKHEKYHNKYPNIIVRGFRMFLPGGFIQSFKKTENIAFLNKISSPERTKFWQQFVCRMYDLSRDIWGWQAAITANLSIRKKYLEQVGGFSRDFVFWGSEDTDLGYRLGNLKMKLLWDKNIKVYHLYHPSESGDKLNTLLMIWIGTNILYRKYLDRRISIVFGTALMRRLDKFILD